MDIPGPDYDQKLADLLPWIMRSEPLAAPLKTPELVRIYEAATKNLWRSDAVVQTVAAALYSVAASRGEVAEEPASIEDFWRIGISNWASNAKAKPLVALGAEGLLSALLVQAWTTLETLVADTWESALNIHPKTLASLAGGKLNKPKGDDRKQVPLDLLQRYSYNLSGSMGTLLREKYRFDSLNGAREAYRDAFGDATAINAALCDPTLDALNAIRQVLVHRAGIADAAYVARTANLPLAPKVPAAGWTILLDGELTSTLLLAGRSVAISFLVAVDDWLSANP